MGKILIIPGADFSVNAINSATLEVDITSDFGPVILKRNAIERTEAVGNVDASRASIINNSMLDVSSYILMGYTKLTVEIESGYAILGIFTLAKCETARVDDGRVYFPQTESGWYTQGGTVDLLASRPWIAINIKKADDSDFTGNESTDLEDYLHITLS